MNEFGEPNMGNPSVRFDEGRERVGHWPYAFQPILSCLLYRVKPIWSGQPRSFLAGIFICAARGGSVTVRHS